MLGQWPCGREGTGTQGTGAGMALAGGRLRDGRAVEWVGVEGWVGVGVRTLLLLHFLSD